jgi:hypothetical protein
MQEYKLRNAKLQSCSLSLIHRPAERPNLLPIISLLVLQTHMRQSKGIAGCMVRVINLCSALISPLYGAHSRSLKSNRNSLRGLHSFGRLSHHLFRGPIFTQLCLVLAKRERRGLYFSNNYEQFS